MGRHEKLVIRFSTMPADFTWDELWRMLSGFGFEKVSGAGSRFKFVRKETGLLIALHRPHPGNIVKRYALRQVGEVLKQGGLMK